MLGWFSKKSKPLDLPTFPKVEFAPKAVLYRLDSDKDDVVRARPRISSRFREEAVVALTGTKRGANNRNLQKLCAGGYFSLQVEKDMGVYTVVGIREGNRYSLGQIPADLAASLRDEPEIGAGFDMARLSGGIVEVGIYTLHLEEKRKLLAAETASFRVALKAEEEEER